MQLPRFHRLRRGVVANAAPAPYGVVASRSRALHAELALHPLLGEVEVERTEDPDRLIVAMCSFGSEVPEQEVVRALTAVWEERLRYPFWSAHAFIVARGHVELQAVSRVSPTGHYLTAHLLALAPVIPAQRRVGEPALTLAPPIR